MDTNTMIHPLTGEILYRDIRPNKFTYKGESIILDASGWYPIGDGEGIFSQEDMKITIEALRILKEKVLQKELAVKSA